MRFMMLMIPKGYENAKPGAMPDAKKVEAMMKYSQALQKAGVLRALDGLHPPSMGARVSFPGQTDQRHGRIRLALTVGGCVPTEPKKESLT